MPLPAADGRAARVQGEVGEEVQVGEQADLRELADAGEEGELDVGVAVLERAVQPPQVVAVGPRLLVAGAGGGPPFVPRELRLVPRVQDRLVVLVHQHDGALARPLVQRLQQVGEASRGGGDAGGGQSGPAFGRGELPHDARAQLLRPLEVAAGEAQPHDGAALRPVPGVVDGQPPEQRLGAFVQLLEGVHEQALAEAPGARQEVVLGVAGRDPSGEGRLVDVVVAFLPDAAEGLDADGEPAPVHGGILLPVRARAPRPRLPRFRSSAATAGTAPAPVPRMRSARRRRPRPAAVVDDDRQHRGQRAVLAQRAVGDQPR